MAGEACPALPTARHAKPSPAIPMTAAKDWG